MSEAYNYTVGYERFLGDVLPYAPGCPEFVATHAIRNACIEFCNKTRFWQVDHDPITGVENVSNYQIDTPTDTEFRDVVEGWYNNISLIPKSMDELAYIYRTLDWRSLNGNPAYITRIEQPEIILVPYPCQTLPEALTLRIAVSPTRDSQTVNAAVWEHYSETIGKGARARLYMQPDQKYTDERMAAQMKSEFERETAQARRRVEKSLGRSDTRIQFMGYV